MIQIRSYRPDFPENGSHFFVKKSQCMKRQSNGHTIVPTIASATAKLKTKSLYSKRSFFKGFLTTAAVIIRLSIVIFKQNATVMIMVSNDKQLVAHILLQFRVKLNIILPYKQISNFIHKTAFEGKTFMSYTATLHFRCTQQLLNRR